MKEIAEFHSLCMLPSLFGKIALFAEDRDLSIAVDLKREEQVIFWYPPKPYKLMQIIFALRTLRAFATADEALIEIAYYSSSASLFQKELAKSLIEKYENFSDVPKMVAIPPLRAGFIEDLIQKLVQHKVSFCVQELRDELIKQPQLTTPFVFGFLEAAENLKAKVYTFPPPIAS